MEVDRRWVNLLTREIQAVEITLVARLAKARGPRWNSCWR